ncbi:MAG TPA: hypothetical protein VIJ47_05690 [Acidimicrobiales bacterium]
MAIQRGASEAGSRFGQTARWVAEWVDDVLDAFDGRNRAFDEALAAPEDEPQGREFPGPEAGCGHVRLLR